VRNANSKLEFLSFSEICTEKKCKTCLRKKQDKLMNRDKGSYQLPHIYDCLLSTTATPGRQLSKEGSVAESQQ